VISGLQHSVYHAQMDLGKHSDCQRSPKARTSLLARSWVSAGNQFVRERDEAQWDAILEAVKQFKQTHGRFPRHNRGDAAETMLYNWLRHNMDTTSDIYTQERANKLVLAFGDRWQSECFPKSIYAW